MVCISSPARRAYRHNLHGCGKTEHLTIAPTVANPAFGQPGALGAGAAAKVRGRQYVTEVVLPPNWELSKEEDLNLLR